MRLVAHDNAVVVFTAGRKADLNGLTQKLVLEVCDTPLLVLLIIHAQRPLQERALLVEPASLRL